MSDVSFMEKLLNGAEVEWKPLGNIATVTIGEFVHKNNQDPSAKYPVYNGGTSHTGFYDKYNNTGNKIIVSARGANAGFVNRISKPYWAGNSCYSIGMKSEDEINWIYVYYYLKNSERMLIGDQQKGGIPAVSKKQMEVLQIPIPCPNNPEKSLAIQAEIVRILDAFTELTTELTTDLNARKKQYNYYRDQLLSFEEGEVEWKTLGDLTIDKFWIMPATPKFDENEDIPYITSKNIRGGHIYFNKVKYISRQDYLNLSRNRPILAGDFLISMIGTIGEVARVKQTDLDFYGQNMYLIRLNECLIHSGYFLHFFDSPKMKRHFNSVKNNSGQGYLKANNIDNIRVPVPPLAEQAHIVAILDKFNTLTTSISEGLPREIELRQKQYEYYRDLLLSFPGPDSEAAA